MQFESQVRLYREYPFHPNFVYLENNLHSSKITFLVLLIYFSDLFFFMDS